MYGFVNSALEKLIKRRFGVEKWDEVISHANVVLGEKDSFHVNHVYKDADTYALVGAASEVLGLDAATILEMFGEQFLLWCQESGYAKTLQLLGRSLRDFLTNLDALHDHLSILYPQMEAPSFRCTPGVKKSEFLLHYYSERAGLENIVMGIVKSVAREYYMVEVDMKLLVKKGDENSDHSIFSIREVANHSLLASDSEQESDTLQSFSEKQLIGSETFCKAFPFHIVFNSDLTVLQVGSSLSWILPNLKLNKASLCKYFALERPRMDLTFDNIHSHINTIFILRMLPSVAATVTTATSSSKSQNHRFSFSGKDPMRLRGQMIFAPESECILFLCSPRVKRLNDLEQRGLYLSDIPIHDATRGMLMMGQAAAAEFSKSVRLEELIIELRAVQKSLEAEKKRMSDLLHEMLPISVADSLMSGQMVEAERFESVTILFSDIVGFTSICSHSGPMEIVNMLNKLYSMFDQVVGQNDVYKVETIGDAYMVVGGLPEKNSIHAECVCNQALDMMHYCKRVLRPDNNEPITMRIGIHSGPVVAGIVGRRMPRYCLFGNTVNVASRTESNGCPGKIQVTEYTYQLLRKRPNFQFEFRDRLEFKNVPEPVNCYYLLKNTENEEFTPVVVSEEPEQLVNYKFMMPLQPESPPTSPQPQPPKSPIPVSPGEMLSLHDYSLPDLRCPFSDLQAPEFEYKVTGPTPTHTPTPTPPNSKRSSIASEFEYMSRRSSKSSTSDPPPYRLRSSSPESESDIESGLYMNVSSSSSPPPPPAAAPSRKVSPARSLKPLEISSSSQSFIDGVRVGTMSPLREDLREDDASPNATDEVPFPPVTKSLADSLQVSDSMDEGICMRKVSDVSLYSVDSGSEAVEPAEKVPVRKISDVSIHSGEGISSKLSDISKDSGNDQEQESESEQLRKLSTSSTGSVEDELQVLRKHRAGSVSKAVEQYDTLTRRRRSGLQTCTQQLQKHFQDEDISNSDNTRQ